MTIFPAKGWDVNRKKQQEMLCSKVLKNDEGYPKYKWLICLIIESLIKKKNP